MQAVGGALRGDGRARVLIRGNHAFALGALAAGCRFVSAYPMTPATSIIEYLASIAAEYGVVTKHAEDEIAAVCMAIGAAHVGARARYHTPGRMRYGTTATYSSHLSPYLAAQSLSSSICLGTNRPT